MERNKHSLATSYYRPADGVIFVYDTTNLETLNKLTTWIDQSKDYCRQHVVCALWGNKGDTYGNPHVEAHHVEGFRARHSQRWHIDLFAEVNAENVSECFQELIKTVHSKLLALDGTMGRSTSTVTMDRAGNIQEEKAESSSGCFSRC